MLLVHGAEHAPRRRFGKAKASTRSQPRHITSRGSVTSRSVQRWANTLSTMASSVHARAHGHPSSCLSSRGVHGRGSARLLARSPMKYARVSTTTRASAFQGMSEARIKVIGCGGGGGNAVNRMINSGLQVRYVNCGRRTRHQSFPWRKKYSAYQSAIKCEGIQSWLRRASAQL